MKLQGWKIRLGDNDFEMKYLEGRQNHVADAFSRIKINEVYYGSNKATAHSAEEDNENLITITEKPINHFARQVEIIRSNTKGEESENYFKKVKIKIMFHELNIEKAKPILIKHFCTKSSAVPRTVIKQGRTLYLDYQIPFTQLNRPKGNGDSSKARLKCATYRR